MTNEPKYKIIPESDIVALLPATIRELATKLERSANSLYERVGLMAARGVIRVGNSSPRSGMAGPSKVYYPGATPAATERAVPGKSDEARIKQIRDCKIEARRVKNEIKQLGEHLIKTNDPHGFQYGVPAPLGVELVLLTAYGKPIVGEWKGIPGDLYTAWAYPPKRNLESEKILARKISLAPNLED